MYHKKAYFNNKILSHRPRIPERITYKVPKALWKQGGKTRKTEMGKENRRAFPRQKSQRLQSIFPQYKLVKLPFFSK